MITMAGKVRFSGEPIGLVQMILRDGRSCFFLLFVARIRSEVLYIIMIMREMSPTRREMSRPKSSRTDQAGLGAIHPSLQRLGPELPAVNLQAHFVCPSRVMARASCHGESVAPYFHSHRADDR